MLNSRNFPGALSKIIKFKEFSRRNGNHVSECASPQPWCGDGDYWTDKNNKTWLWIL
jgi:hypothetical protein